MTNLTYDEISQAMSEAVPDTQGHYLELLRWHTDPPGPYTVFDVALSPVLLPALNSGQDLDLLKRIFAFFETMARSPDVHVQNLLQVAILENLVGDKAKLSVGWPYMGEATKELSRNTARIFRVEKNLPKIKF